jgi:hypothetical protein
MEGNTIYEFHNKTFGHVSEYAHKDIVAIG